VIEVGFVKDDPLRSAVSWPCIFYCPHQVAVSDIQVSAILAATPGA